MITTTKTEYVGEYLGPIDWNYDFKQHNWNNFHGGVNPKIAAESCRFLKKLETELNQNLKCKIWANGICHEVIKIGMYDGWPFLKPTPSVCIKTWSSNEWLPWYCVRE